LLTEATIPTRCRERLKKRGIGLRSFLFQVLSATMNKTLQRFSFSFVTPNLTLSKQCRPTNERRDLL
jgi:hypothetical protein